MRINEILSKPISDNFELIEEENTLIDDVSKILPT